MLRVPSTLTYSVAIGVSITLVYWCYRQWKNRKPKPEIWRRIGTLDQINIFPINFCAPLKFDADAEVHCDMFGLKLNYCRDRALVMVTCSNKMITKEMYPRTALINTKLVGSRLELSAPGMKTIALDMSIFKSEAEQFGLMVRTSLANVCFVGEEYDKWLSKFLLNEDSGIRLIHYPIKRPVKPINSRMLRQPYILKKDGGTISDPTCLVLTNLSSVEEISARLGQSLDPLMFYGSFHLKMDVHQPFTEEFWTWVKIGDEVIFRVITDEKTANHDPNGELVNTLKKDFPSIAFVVYLGLHAVGTIKKGAVIYVKDK